MASSSSSFIKYDQTPDQEFFLCSKCKTHISLRSSFVFHDPQANIGVVENELVNVRVEGEDKKWFEYHTSRTYVQVYCLGCETLLGKQVFDIEHEDVVAKKGRFALFMKKLMLWDGEQMRYAHNGEPVNASKKPVDDV